MFMVRVPVLSLQIVVAEPIVSHADKCLTCINLRHSEHFVHKYYNFKKTTT
jgi:hypothetical protein